MYLWSCMYVFVVLGKQEEKHSTEHTSLGNPSVESGGVGVVASHRLWPVWQEVQDPAAVLV